MPVSLLKCYQHGAPTNDVSSIVIEHLAVTSDKALRQPRGSPEKFCLRPRDWCGHLHEANEEEEEEEEEEEDLQGAPTNYFSITFMEHLAVTSVLPSWNT